MAAWPDRRPASPAVPGGGSAMTGKTCGHRRGHQNTAASWYRELAKHKRPPRQVGGRGDDVERWAGLQLPDLRLGAGEVMLEGRVAPQELPGPATTRQVQGVVAGAFVAPGRPADGAMGQPQDPSLPEARRSGIVRARTGAHSTGPARPPLRRTASRLFPAKPGKRNAPHAPPSFAAIATAGPAPTRHRGLAR